MKEASHSVPTEAIRRVRPRRTPELILLVLGMLLFAFLGLLRFQQAVSNWALLTRIQAEPGPLYLAASGFVWALTGLLTALVLWFGRRWAAAAAQVGVSVLAVTYWAERLLLYRSPASMANTLFAVFLTVLLIGYTLIVIALPRQRRFFQRPAAARRFFFWRDRDGKSGNRD